MNESQLSIRLIGELPPSADLENLLGESPDIDRRRGMPPLYRSGRAQEVDVWAVTLIDRSEWNQSSLDKSALDRAIDRLRRMAPSLASLSRQGFRAQWYVSTIQDQDQGGFELPAEVIALAGEAHLEMFVSILDVGGDDDDDDSAEAGGPSDPAPGTEAELP